MENNLTIKSAVNYSNAFVEKVSKSKFDEKDTITGQELPKLTEIKQINFLLIYILLQSWKSEINKLKSPYFDFTNDQVKQALETFMNVLSQNISIQQKDFEPLLKKAFQLALLYFNNPISFLSEIFQDKVSKKELKELSKLVKSHFIEGIISFLDDESLDEIELDELEPSSLESEDPTEFLKALTSFLNIKQEEEEKETDTKKEPAGFANQFKVTPNLNDSFQKEGNKATLNDQHSDKQESKTILESHSKTKVESISQEIPLNEQFQLTNDVFGGMKSVYNSFIEKVDAADSFADATLLVDEFISKTEHRASNRYLHKLVDRKFMS